MIHYASNLDDHYAMVLQELRNACRSVTITTFRITNAPFVTNILNKILVLCPKVRLIVGVGEFMVTEDFMAIRQVVEQSPKVSVRILMRSHAKLWAFERGRRRDHTAIVSSRNFGTGDWHESSVLLSGPPTAYRVVRHTTRMWDNARAAADVIKRDEGVNKKMVKEVRESFDDLLEQASGIDPNASRLDVLKVAQSVWAEKNGINRQLLKRGRRAGKAAP